jgi:predicted PurR-regulated permease PerM
MKEKLTPETLTFWARVVIPIALALISILAVAPRLSSVETYRGTIEMLDAEKSNVLTLTGASTAVSASVTLLPGDICTPIAEKLMDLSQDFTIVLCAIYFEKYMLTVLGYFVFTWLLPAALLLYVVNVFLRRDGLRTLAIRLFTFGLCIYLIIPTSVKISGMINEVYQSSIDATITAATESAGEIEAVTGNVKSAEETEQEQTVLEKIAQNVEEGVVVLSQDIAGATARLKATVDRYIDALAVMIVTSCVIPIVVVIVFLWLARILVGLDIHLPHRRARKGRMRPAA